MTRSDFLKIALASLPGSCLFFGMMYSFHFYMGACRELVPRMAMMSLIAWLASVTIAWLITKRLLWLHIVWGGILAIFLLFSLDMIGHALAEDWAMAERVRNGTKASYEGTGADWRELYSELHGNRQGIGDLNARDFFSNLKWSAFIMLGWIPITFLVVWPWRYFNRRWHHRE